MVWDMHFCCSQLQSTTAQENLGHPYACAHTCFCTRAVKFEAFLLCSDYMKPPVKNIKGFFLQIMRQLVDHASWLWNLEGQEKQTDPECNKCRIVRVDTALMEIRSHLEKNTNKSTQMNYVSVTWSGSMWKQALLSSLSVFTKVTLLGFSSALLQHKLQNTSAWPLLLFVEMADTDALEKQWK